MSSGGEGENDDNRRCPRLRCRCRGTHEGHEVQRDNSKVKADVSVDNAVGGEVVTEHSGVELGVDDDGDVAALAAGKLVSKSKPTSHRSKR